MTLLEKYIIARWCYAIGEDYIGDIEYNALHEQIKREFPDNEYVNRSWSDDPCPVELLKKLDLMKYYRDIKFAYKSESIRSINSIEDLERELRGLNEESRLSYKLDGFNIQANYYNREPNSAETRGRTGNSLNANTVIEVVPKKIPYGGMVKVTGETVISDKAWKQFLLEYDNVSQRSSVSTCLANGLSEYLSFIAFDIKVDGDTLTGDPYKLLQECGFKTPHFMMVSNYQQLLAAIRVMGARAAAYGYPTDGLVLENSKMQVAIRVGKWQEQILQSYVTGYGENVGMHNNPIIAKIEPIKSSEGKTYSEVSVTNLQYLLDYDLQIGSPIAFYLRSMSTPVLNMTETERLHREYAGHYEEYRSMIKGV